MNLIGDERLSNQFSKIEDTISGPERQNIRIKKIKRSNEDIFKLAENGENIAIEIIEDLINRIAIY